MAQVWDQVKVKKAGDKFEGVAGLVVKADDKAELNEVKLDNGETAIYAYTELEHLGR